jgi:putative nucleotidyltransferase with HDIG domain
MGVWKGRGEDLRTGVASPSESPRRLWSRRFRLTACLRMRLGGTPRWVMIPSMQQRRIETPEDAEALLVEVGAPERLIMHGRLVLEAADELLARAKRLGVAIDGRLVRAGAVLHDVGKTVHADELQASGAQHEEAGERLLLARGIEPAVARCCVSHARWGAMTCSLEELLVALADALWKGVRRESLEKRVGRRSRGALGRRPMVDLRRA